MAEFPLVPGSTIGVLGGGQLGRMLALAAARLGFDVVIQDPEENSPAGRVAARQIVAAYDDRWALKRLAEASDVVTYEFENVPADTVAELAALGAMVSPGAKALAAAQDRVVEKSFLAEIGVPTVAFAPVHDSESLAAAVAKIGAPSLLKTRREGYDGKGQAWIQKAADAEASFDKIGRQDAILEAPADFGRELSVIAARGRDGEIACYPLAENHHEGGVLRRTVAPAKVTPATRDQAEAIAAKILTALDYVGVIGVELFELADGKLLVNEFAPRVHNTGHWTQDGCEVDQFEQHIRAVAGWPLGPTAPHHHVEMTNLLGADVDAWKKLAAEPETRVHLYGKGEARPGRKMGHVNRLRPLRD
ncbi:5-(carboxyamino)imidazole ribonucleotide synthase [Caulobacter sp. RHG1]|uniref:5-(carboxyamino)imidazole ribonucleotide synthase n=1 Tax=Caulobacter sp. (strain RHG1) TaxID=2545762 RepID=UPI001554B0F1|nr:5-(carboxyamino)imidazole ribonucleotide synthase [Caulobacter sp. RHG1]NQE63858.1 N5-carboxyaminoimidazole ribonucleotide synthase [Caulobacter sp. RHG1]